MHILLLNDDHPLRGKSSVAAVVRGLMEEYGKRGHRVSVITSHRTETSPEAQREGAIVSLPVSYRRSLRHYHCLYSPPVSAMLAAELGRLRPDVVHAHNIHMYLTYDALRLARRVTPRVFLTAHDVMSIAFGRLNTARYLASGGGDTSLTVADHLRAAGLQYNPVRNLWIRRVLSAHTRSVFAVSGALKRALDAHGIPRVHVVHNGIDTAGWRKAGDEARRARETYGTAGRQAILFGGRLSADKGALPLLEALSRIRGDIPGALLLVIGDKARWEGLLRSAQISPDTASLCRFAGWVARPGLPDAYAACDVVAIPSLCLDCFPTMALEAMAAGKPLVGTIFGGTREAVEDGKTGCIVDPRDTLALADSLSALLRQQEKAAALGTAGRARVEERFTVARQADILLEAYAPDA